MSEEHKAKLAAGREHASAVRRYLDALEANRPKRGRRRTPESIKKRLETIESNLSSANSLARLQMLQERSDLQEELNSLENGAEVDLSELEANFVKAAGDYGRRKSISYSTWRAAGVPAPVLKRAGITRGVSD